ncbi:MAG: PAS domain S-box protein [Oligoflexia bacterium]|nr:PAS domain S-box protein [Oligoflexia bacterium]
MFQKEDLNPFNLTEVVIKNSIDGILAFDLECRYTLWNSAMERISGKTSAECMGKLAFEVFPFLRESGEDKYFLRALNGEIVRSSNRQYKIPELGREGYFEAVYSPLYNEQKNVVGGLGVIREITERKLYEAAISESEFKYKSVTQFANDAIISCNELGVILSWNDGAKKIFDYQESEIVGKKLDLLIPKTVWSHYLHEINNITNRDELIKKGRVTEVYGYRKHGSSFPMEVMLSSWRRGSEIYLSAIVRDVTDRKHIENQAEERQQLYHALMQAQSDLGEGVVIIDATTERYVYVNEAFCKLTGFSESELFAMENIMALVPHDQLQLVLKRHAFRKQKNIDSSQFEIECIRKDGSRIQIDIAVKSIETSHGLSLIGLVRDITERKKTEQTLKETSMSTQKLIQLARDIIVTTLADGSIALLSPVFKEITGWSTSEWLGKNFETLLHSDDHEQYRTLCKSVLEGKTSAVTQLRWKTSQGIYQDIEISMAPMFGNGRVMGGLAIIRDLSERRKQEQVILEEQKRFQALVEASGMAVVVTEKGRIIESNHKFAKMFGFAPTEVIGKSASEFSVPVDRERIRTFISVGYEAPYQFTGLRKDGSTFSAEVRGKNFKYKGLEIRVAALSDLS